MGVCQSVLGILGLQTDYSLKTPAPPCLPVYYRLLTVESTGGVVIIGLDLAEHPLLLPIFFLSIVSDSP